MDPVLGGDERMVTDGDLSEQTVESANRQSDEIQVEHATLGYVEPA